MGYGANPVFFQHSSSSYHHHPLVRMSDHFLWLSKLFTILSEQCSLYHVHGQSSHTVQDVALLLTFQDLQLGSISPLKFFGLSSTPPPSSAPPPAPSPQEELQLLCTSFDAAFASLAGQVKELVTKVNSSGPPPKVATAKKPSAQPTPKPHAQPPSTPVPTPASRPAPPSFASVVKAPA